MRERFRDTVLTMLGSFIPTANASRLRVGLQLSRPWLAITWARSGCFAHSLRVPDSRVVVWGLMAPRDQVEWMALRLPDDPAGATKEVPACVRPSAPRRQIIWSIRERGREAEEKRRRRNQSAKSPKRASFAFVSSLVRADRILKEGLGRLSGLVLIGTVHFFNLIFLRDSWSGT